jgi:hypothetical protein
MQSIDRKPSGPRQAAPKQTRPRVDFLEGLMGLMCPEVMSRIDPDGRSAAQSPRPPKRNFSEVYHDAQYHDPEDYSSQESWVRNNARAVALRDASVPATETRSGSPVSRVSCTPGMEIMQLLPVVRGTGTGDPEVSRMYNSYCGLYSKAILVAEAFSTDLAPKFTALKEDIDRAKGRYMSQEKEMMDKANGHINSVLEAKVNERLHYQNWESLWRHQRDMEQKFYQLSWTYWSQQKSARQDHCHQWVEYCEDMMGELDSKKATWTAKLDSERVAEELKHQEWCGRFDEMESKLTRIHFNKLLRVQDAFEKELGNGNFRLRELKQMIVRLQTDWVTYNEGMDSFYRNVSSVNALEAHLMKKHREWTMPQVNLLLAPACDRVDLAVVPCALFYHAYFV